MKVSVLLMSGSHGGPVLMASAQKVVTDEASTEAMSLPATADHATIAKLAGVLVESLWLKVARAPGGN